MKIRQVHINDLAAVVAIEQANFSPEEQIEESVLAYYLKEEAATCLVMEDKGELAGYILALKTPHSVVTDDLFTRQEKPEGQQDYLGIVSLSVAEAYKGKGVGTNLLAALKALAIQEGYQGISLTCKEYLVAYYAKYQFDNLGISASKFGGKIWYDMYWECVE